jgi:hypothetical protein
MFRFVDLVRGSEIVRDVKQRYPETEPVFERFGLRPPCYDCSIEQAARKAGVLAGDLLQEINETVLETRRLAA